MGRKQDELKAEDWRRLVNRLLREYLGPMGRVSLDLVQIELEIESDRDKISLDCFPSLRTINMYPMLFKKGGTSSRLTNNNLGASPPLTLGFYPSKRHAALITSRDQGSIVLAFTLVLLVLKRFLWRFLTFTNAPDLYTASVRFVVAFPLEYSPKIYQSVDRQWTY